MKVSFFQFYPFTLWTPGGGEMQMKKTISALSNHGVTTELFDINHPTKEFDILHVFGSSYQLSDFVVAVHRLGKKVIVSAIAYSNKSSLAWQSGKFVSSVCPLPTVYTYRKRIYDNADIIISGSEAESEQLQKYFSVPRQKIRVIFNAADKDFSKAEPAQFSIRHNLQDFILEVGRINRRKGQLKLIEAMEGSGEQVVFIGTKDPEDPGYFDEFLKICEKKSWVHYLGPVADQSFLAAAYASAKVHVLPSIAEFPGLVNLEAGMTGTRVVAGDSAPTREHLGEFAFYCNPNSISSIKRAILAAIESPKSNKLQERLLENFTWQKIAADTMNVYNQVLDDSY